MFEHPHQASVHAAESAQLPTTEDNNLAPPRLPSISCLLNSIPPPPDRSPDDATPSQERHGSIPSLTVERTDPPASPSLALPVPPPPASHRPSSTDYTYPLPYEYGSRTSNEDVRPPSAASPRTYSPTTSQNPAHTFGNRSFYPSAPQHAPVFDAYPPQYDAGNMESHRQRSASFNAFQPYPPPSQSLPAPYPGRPYPGFATSSERRSSGSDERGTSHGGLGPWRNRRRGPEPHFDGNAHALPPPSAQAAPSQHPSGQWLQPSSYSPTRPRALSISTADEYYAGRPAWSTMPASMGPPHPLQHLDPSQRRTESDPYPMEYFHRPFPPGNSFNRAAPLSAGVSNDFSYLRLGPGEYPRHHLQQHQNVPPALPIPPPLPPTPTEAHPDLRPIVLPSGLAGSAPSSAGSTSTSLFSAHSGNGLPTPLSAGPTPSLPSPSTSASTTFELNGSGLNEGAGDASGSTDSGKYCCPHCSKRFARPSSLRIHTFSHTGEKPFTCPQCDRAFSVQSNLRRHLKIHKNVGDLNSASASRARSRTAPQPHSGGTTEFDRRNSADMEEDEDQDAEGERDE